MTFEHLHGDDRKPVLVLSSLEGTRLLNCVIDVKTEVNMTLVKRTQEYDYYHPYHEPSSHPRNFFQHVATSVNPLIRQHHYTIPQS